MKMILRKKVEVIYFLKGRGGAIEDIVSNGRKLPDFVSAKLGPAITPSNDQ